MTKTIFFKPAITNFSQIILELKNRKRNEVFPFLFLFVLSQNANTGKWAQLYWIDHTENYYRTLQLATKYDEKEYILHDFSDYVEGIGQIAIDISTPMGNGLGGSSGHVRIGDKNFDYDNKWTSISYIEDYLRNVYLPEHNLKGVYYSGVIIGRSDGGDATVSGFVMHK